MKLDETQQILSVKRKRTDQTVFSANAENSDFVHKTLNKIIRKY